MESLVRCAGCGKKPRVKANASRRGWGAEVRSPQGTSKAVLAPPKRGASTQAYWAYKQQQQMAAAAAAGEGGEEFLEGQCHARTSARASIQRLSGSDTHFNDLPSHSLRLSLPLCLTHRRSCAPFDLRQVD